MDSPQLMAPSIIQKYGSAQRWVTVRVRVPGMRGDRYERGIS